jgi:predicted nucleic acid-binding protein
VKLFLDTNIVLDVLARRQPAFAASARVMAHVELGRASGHIAAHTFTTLHYLLAKHAGAKRPPPACLN